MDLGQLIPNNLSLADALDLIGPLSVYVAGIAVYAVFVFNFYRFVSSRDMFKIDVYKFEESRFRFLRSLIHLVGYIAKYLILFPVFAFIWFAVLTFMLTFLSDGRDMADTLLIALATVSAIRFAAYYNEDLSRDLAKILPFALLALFLIDASYIDLTGSFDEIVEATDHIETIIYYLLFLIVLELVLRFGFGFSVWLFTKRPVRNPAPQRRRQKPVQQVEEVEQPPSPAPAIQEPAIEEERAPGPAGAPPN